MKIYLVRHGESESDVEDLYGGAYDDHLTELGKKKALNVANKLKGKKVEVIFSSPYHRAKECAEILKNALKVKFEVKFVEGLKERNRYGFLSGKSIKESQQVYPLETAKLATDYKYFVVGGEDYESFKKRVIEGFGSVLNSKHDVVAVVAHGGPIRCFVREMLKLGELKKFEHGAVFELEAEGNEVRLVKAEGAELAHGSAVKFVEIKNDKGIF